MKNCIGFPLVGRAANSASFSASIWALVGAAFFPFLLLPPKAESRSGNSSCPAITPVGTNSEEVGLKPVLEEEAANGLSSAIAAYWVPIYCWGLEPVVCKARDGKLSSFCLEFWGWLKIFYYGCCQDPYCCWLLFDISELFRLMKLYALFRID
jgi:hypothetical protein